MLVSLLFVIPQTVKAADEISYAGSISIGAGIIEAGAAKSFEQKSGIKFKTIDNSGSGKGIQALLAEKATLAGLGRPIKPEEKKQNLSATTIGYDAIAVFVHKNNPVKNLSKEQLKGIFTGKITNWKQVGGGNAPIAPSTENLTGALRGAVEMVQKMVLDGAQYGKGFKQLESPVKQLADLSLSENGICTVSLGLLPTVTPEVRGKIKKILVDNIPADDKNIQSGAYLVSVPLQLVTKGLPKGSEKEFIKFILSGEGQTIVEKNYVAVRRQGK